VEEYVLSAVIWSDEAVAVILLHSCNCTCHFLFVYFINTKLHCA
jgi:hypothetical protein